MTEAELQSIREALAGAADIIQMCKELSEQAHPWVVLYHRDVSRLLFSVEQLNREWESIRVDWYEDRIPDRPWNAGPPEQRVSMLLASLAHEVDRLRAEVGIAAAKLSYAEKQRDNAEARVRELQAELAARDPAPRSGRISP